MTNHEAQTWASNNYSAIELTLQKAHDETINRLATLSDWIDPPGQVFPDLVLDKDLFSSSLCHSFVALMSNDNPKLIKVTHGTLVTHDGTTNDHSWLKLQNTTIDATVGQYLKLEQVIAQYPHYFVGRILVATSGEIEKAFRLQYRPG